MSEIVKKGFFRRCLYRMSGAYLLEQHIQQLEQRAAQAEAQVQALQKRTDHLECHSEAQDAHRNAIDAQLRQTAAQAEQVHTRLEKAEDCLVQAGMLRTELQLFNKKSYSQAGEDAILMYIFVIWIWGQTTPVI